MLEILTTKAKLQIPVIHEFLTQSYWAKGRSLDAVKSAIEHSFCFGVYWNGTQIGFARIVTDHTVFAYVMDVFILPEYRGNGYAKILMQNIIDAPELSTCKVWLLKTADAHGLYEPFGFKKVAASAILMERKL